MDDSINTQFDWTAHFQDQMPEWNSLNTAVFISQACKQLCDAIKHDQDVKKRDSEELKKSETGS